MDFLVSVIGVVLLYAGCVLLFQGSKRRARHKAVRLQPTQGVLAQRIGWAMILLALIPLSIPSGLEIGAVVWLAALALAGIASLLISALAPRLHLPSALGVVGFCLIIAVPYSVLGGTL